MNLERFSFNDGLQNGGRKPRLYLAKDGKATKFNGCAILGLCAIAAQKFEKNGKWSNTTYQLLLAPGVRAIEFLSPLHGTWGDDIESWGQACERLALPLETVKAVVGLEYPKTAKRWDELEVFLTSCQQ